MKERLQKIISARGLASRRTAEEWLRAGRICVNGAPAALGDIADPETDHITVDGAPLPAAPEKRYLMLNKPRGYITTLDDEKGRKTAASLINCGCLSIRWDGWTVTPRASCSLRMTGNWQTALCIRAAM